MTRKADNCGPFELNWLRDPVNAAEFLNSMFEDHDKDAFFHALREVAEAHGGLAAIARKTRVSRSTLNKTFFEDENPDFCSMSAMLQALGLRLTVAPETCAARKRTAPTLVRPKRTAPTDEGDKT